MDGTMRRLVLPLLLSSIAGCGSRPPASPGDAAPGSDGVAPGPRWAELDGRRVRYVEAGTDDPALVLVHGWASDKRVWQPHIGPLSAAHRVLAIDLPGHGESDEPAAAYSMDLFARGIAAALDGAGIVRVVLVGHSNGVPTVRQFYRLYPARTLGLVLVDGPLRAMLDEARAQRYLARFRGDDFREHVGAFLDGMPPYELTPQWVAALREMATAQSQAAVVGGLAAAVDPAIWGEDPIGCPVLMINAQQPAWSVEYEIFVRSLVPDLDYRLLGGVSHFLMLDRPQEFNALVEEFVGGIGS
jgi:pimeloyl-ACP methyl ester carboxylesterase